MRRGRGCFLVLGFWVSALVGCSSKSQSVACGVGTELVGATCVPVPVSDAGADRSVVDAGVDVSAPDGPRDGPADAPSADVAQPVDAGDGGDDADGGDATVLSMPLPCGDVNACVPGGGLPGPLDIGIYDTCLGAPSGPGMASGNQSGWVKVTYRHSCTTVPVFVFVSSDPSALFDVEVYEAPAQTVVSACPALVGSAKAVIQDSGANPAALVMVTPPGDLYIHVLAEQGTMCTSTAVWQLALGGG